MSDTEWTSMPLTAFDLETTSADPSTARVVTAHIATIDGSSISGQDWLLDPEIDIPDGAAAVHGITTERARQDGQDYADGYREIRDALERAWMNGRVICAYNASFDFTIIDQEGQRLGHPALQCGPIFDPFVVDRAIDKYRRGKRTLGVTCAHYGITLDNAHAADADAIAAARLAWVLGRKVPELGQMSAEALMEQQAAWHKERQEDFAAYLRRTGKDASGVDGSWPVRTLPTSA